MVKAIEKLGHAVILRVTNYVMLFAPIAVFAAITIITTQGVGVLLTYGTLLAEYYSLGVLWTAGCSS
ncbi:MAG: cation:dicarboxylase symporter family transporter [Rhodospirillales bacterium]